MFPIKNISNKPLRLNLQHFAEEPTPPAEPPATPPVQTEPPVNIPVEGSTNTATDTTKPDESPRTLQDDERGELTTFRVNEATKSVPDNIKDDVKKFIVESGAQTTEEIAAAVTEAQRLFLYTDKPAPAYVEPSLNNHPTRPPTADIDAYVKTLYDRVKRKK